VSTLESLADALPEMEPMPAAQGEAKIKHKSLRSRPGAMKRREKLEKMERERFGKNMAQLVEKKEGEAGEVVTATERRSGKGGWAALRGFISQTMETKPEFAATDSK
jgi:hypothetical protein